MTKPSVTFIESSGQPSQQPHRQRVVRWLTVWLLFAGGGVLAQTISPDESLSGLSQRYRTSAGRTLQLARKMGWPLRKNYSNGRTLQLQEVDETGFPVYYGVHNANAALLTQTATLHPGGGAGLSLSGAAERLNGRLGIWDGGRALVTHREFGLGPSRVQNKESTGPFSDHTTHLAGTLVAQGLKPAARGMAFGAQLLVWDYTNDVPEMASAAQRLLLSNHAYGPVTGWVLNPDRPGTSMNQKWEWWGNPGVSSTEDYQFGFYTQRAADIDQIQYSNPYYLVVRSADNKRAETGPPPNTPYYLRNTNEQSLLPRSRNDGYDVIAAEATAKNALTVGAADVITGPGQTRKITVSSYSGWGPTDDGRIKPDLLGVGLPLHSTLATGPLAYGNFTGTSMASANVTGSLLLLQELYSRNQPDHFMRAATLKALVLHTATRTPTSVGLAIPPPDYRQGWGLLALNDAAQVLLNDNGAHFLQEATLLQEGVYTYQLVAEGNEPLVVTISWTDPEGPPTPVASRYLNSRVPKLVNDLDLRLMSGPETYYPWQLNPNRPADPATTGDNLRDNTEQIVVQSPRPGQLFTIRVSHKGTLRYGAQPFSLIVSGQKHTPCALAVSLLPPSDTTFCSGKPLSLTLGNVRITGSTMIPSGTSYEWFLNGQAIPGATATTCKVDGPGQYALRVTTNSGCVGTSPATHIVGLPAIPTLLPQQAQLLCATRPSVLLRVTKQEKTSYEWLRNGKLLSAGFSATYVASEPGQYTVRLGQQGCQQVSAPVLIESAAQLITDILPPDRELFLPAASSIRLQAEPEQPGYQYQWFRNSQALPGATADNLLVSAPGQYQVQLKQEGCTALVPGRMVRWTESAQLALLADSLLQRLPPNSNILLTPNPATDQVQVQYFRAVTPTPTAALYSPTGALLTDWRPLAPKDGILQLIFPTTHLPSGAYFVQVSDGPRVRSAQFIKR